MAPPGAHHTSVVTYSFQLHLVATEVAKVATAVATSFATFATAVATFATSFATIYSFQLHLVATAVETSFATSFATIYIYIDKSYLEYYKYLESWSPNLGPPFESDPMDENLTVFFLNQFLKDLCVLYVRVARVFWPFQQDEGFTVVRR